MKFNVPDMSCGHCTAAIEKAIKAADANAKVECDLAARSVAVQSALDEIAVSAAIRGAGYDSSVVAAA
ncbi:MAG: heavy-metal-associated domain-containing protein [Paracoccaceae bacterium]